jgi:polar amino acid transport system substrate-binding protein
LVCGPERGIVISVKIPAITTILAALLLSAITPVASAQSPTSQAPLKVGVHVHEPFVLQSGQEYQGFSIDLWKEIAADLGRGSDFIPYQSLPELLEAVSSGKADVGVSGIFVTEERLKTVDFSQPFLHGGLQVMVHERRGSSFMKVWNGLRESGHLKVFGLGICVILAATLVLTVAERRWNAEFHADWANGLSESFYHVMSIVMTGKSSHKGLPGPWGRVLGAFWIAFGVGVVAYITSSVTSIMTVNSLVGIIKGPQNLPGHRVGIIPGTVGAQYCADHRLDTTSFGKLEEAVQALVNRRIDAIVLDAITLQWYDNSHPELPITEVGPIFDKKSYAFALPIGSTLRQGINKSLLKQNESGFLETLRKQYFGDIQ